MPAMASSSPAPGLGRGQRAGGWPQGPQSNKEGQPGSTATRPQVQSRVVPALSLGGPLVLSEQFLNTRQQAARGPGLSCDRAAEVGWGAREPRPHGCPPLSLPGVPNWPSKRGPGLGSFSRADRGIGGVRPVQVLGWPSLLVHRWFPVTLSSLWGPLIPGPVPG